ncbi:MAG TPA: sigma-70 family RNA polymerase sigma factor [Fulvivirga sp.]|nr:sigma-70 family RNA polymerase sigma factor [Fulvivirga sp.]
MNDKDLVRQVLNGHKASFEILIKRYQKLVAHMVGRVISRQEDHEEICQDVFVRVFEKLNEFKFESKLSTWIATIAYRLSINFINKNQLKLADPEMAEILFNKNYIEELSPGKRMEMQDSAEHIQEMVMLLPVQFRVVLTLFHLEEMSYPEIEEVTGMPIGTIKSYLFRGRKLLKEKMELFMKTEEL